MFRNLKTVLLAVGVIMVFGLSASMGFGDSVTPGTAEKAVTVGNKVCPVTGEKIDKESEVTYEYKGKVYSFCCRACIIEFRKDPEKYIEKMNTAGEGTDEKAGH